MGGAAFIPRPKQVRLMLTLLNPSFPEQPFPSPEKALKEPDGLLAIGGCLSPPRLINAYRHGIFPWYGPGEPMLWWSPDPRLVIFPDKLHLSKSLRKTIRKNTFSITIDKAFNDVINACSESRKKDSGTWISEEIKQAYTLMHRLGHVHSIEAWRDKQLVGGLYGVSIGQVFFGESMFHRQTDASKVAFAWCIQYLLNWNYQLVDCQVATEHLISLGAEQIPRKQFQLLLNRYCSKQPDVKAWKNP